jgi:hypothetical protein
MKNRALMFLGSALLAQLLVVAGCSSSDTSPGTGTGGSTGAGGTPVMTGTGGTSTTGTGGTSATGTGGTGADPIGAPCPSGVKNKLACTTEPACFNTCGPLKSGIKNCSCAAAMWSCPSCAFPAGADYTCYHLPTPLAACPADMTDPSGMMLPQSGSPCTLAPCTPCGSGTGNAYRDSSGTPKIGYCVCSSATNGTYSCASTAEWPPQ